MDKGDFTIREYSHKIIRGGQKTAFRSEFVQKNQYFYQ